VNVVEALESLWQGLLDLTSKLVIPDWTALIALMPVFLVIGVLGPILTLVVLGWIIYQVRRPRTRIHFDEGPVRAPIGPDGKPILPTAEPVCYRDGLIYPPGVVRCEVCRDELSVICPKCGVGREVSVAACGNCGLELRLQPRPRALVPAGPKPGGAAAA
jgi:hypothetical protein